MPSRRWLLSGKPTFQVVWISEIVRLAKMDLSPRLLNASPNSRYDGVAFDRVAKVGGYSRVSARPPL